MLRAQIFLRKTNGVDLTETVLCFSSDCQLGLTSNGHCYVVSLRLEYGFIRFWHNERFSNQDIPNLCYQVSKLLPASKIFFCS